jgi:hypothetical protein
MKLLSVSKRGTRLGKYSEFVSFFSDLSAGSHAEIHYNPLTAAVEKIPLSVVLVNKKPQHIVFCLFLGHPLSKHWRLPVESSRQPCGTRLSGSSHCLKFSAGQPGWWSANHTSKPSPRRGQRQDAETVHFEGKSVEMWRFGAGFCSPSLLEVRVGGNHLLVQDAHDEHLVLLM